MDLEVYGMIGLILFIILILVCEVVAVILVAGFIATYLGLSGIMWWAVAFVVFLLINGLIGLVSRVGK